LRKYTKASVPLKQAMVPMLYYQPQSDVCIGEILLPAAHLASSMVGDSSYFCCEMAPNELESLLRQGILDNTDVLCPCLAQSEADAHTDERARY